MNGPPRRGQPSALRSWHNSTMLQVQALVELLEEKGVQAGMRSWNG